MNSARWIHDDSREQWAFVDDKGKTHATINDEWGQGMPNRGVALLNMQLSVSLAWHQKNTA